MSLDDATQAERDFFASRGRNTEALLAENKDGVQRVADETPVQEAPAAGADTATRSPPSQEVAEVNPPSPTSPETKSAPAPLEEEETRLEQQTKRVSWNKYQAERDRAENERKSREALEAKEREWIAERAAVNERLRLFNDALKDDQPQQVEEDAPPDPMQDAYAYMQWQTRELQRQKQALEEYQQRQGAFAQDQQIRQLYDNDVMRFSQQQPWFPYAADFIYKKRLEQLEILEPWKTPEQRQLTVNQEAVNSVKDSLQNGISPAERFFNYARTLGFDQYAQQLNAQWQQQQNNQSAAPAAGNGAATNGMSPPTAAAPLNPQTLGAVQQVQAIAQNQAASRSLSNAGGGTPVQNLDAKSLASMSQEEFEAVFNRLQGSRNKAALRDLMGY